MRRIALPVLVTLILPLAGCAGFPELQDGGSAAAMAAPYPKLAPLPPLLAQGKAVTISAEDEAATAARGAALRAKAERLRRLPPP